MSAVRTPARKPRWFMIPVRVLLVTFLLTLLTFAVSLLLGIVGIVIGARLRGVPPNMTLAYKNIAAPAAAMVGVFVVFPAVSMETRHSPRAGTRDEIKKKSR